MTEALSTTSEPLAARRPVRRPCAGSFLVFFAMVAELVSAELPESLVAARRVSFPTTFQARGRRPVQTVDVAAAGNLDPVRGAVAFWFKPHWTGESGNVGLFGFGDNDNDLSLRAFPEAGEAAHQWKNRLLWMFRGKADGREYAMSCVTPPMPEWRPQAWHHVLYRQYQDRTISSSASPDERSKR